MKKKLFIFCFIFLFLSSCGKPQTPKDKLIKIENDTNVHFLSSANIIFYYSNVSGWDSAGVMYFVLQYDERPTELFSQFYVTSELDSTIKETAKIGNNKDEEFEKSINSIINGFIDDYDKFDEEYKIDWEKKYSFITNKDFFRTCPIIYFEDSKTAILIAQYF